MAKIVPSDLPKGVRPGCRSSAQRWVRPAFENDPSADTLSRRPLRRSRDGGQPADRARSQAPPSTRAGKFCRSVQVRTCRQRAGRTVPRVKRPTGNTPAAITKTGVRSQLWPTTSVRGTFRSFGGLINLVPPRGLNTRLDNKACRCRIDRTSTTTTPIERRSRLSSPSMKPRWRRPARDSRAERARSHSFRRSASSPRLGREKSNG